jgi:rhodanese-related sulfurtransferase
MLNIIKEALLVALMGAVLAFAANAFSPRGLKLSANYFPADNRSAQGMPNQAGPVLPSVTNLDTGVDPKLVQALQNNGLKLTSLKEAQAFYNDPARLQDQIIFIDARDDEHYQAGHIPGAYQFHHYHPENYLPTVLPVVQVAREIVVYCHGGQCEDSLSAALFLKNSAGIPGEKLHVFAGGITEWENQKLPVEIGERNSGQLRH